MEMLEGNEAHSDNDCGELKMFKISKSTCEGEPRSLVYKFFRTTGPLSTEKCSPSLSDDSHPDFEDILRRSVSLSPSVFPSEDSKLLSFDSEVSPEDIIDSNYPDIAEMPYSSPAEPKLYSPPIKSGGQELRRSLRLQALRSKAATSLEIPKQEEEPTGDTECKGSKRKRRATVSKRHPSKIRRGIKETSVRGRKRGRSLDTGNSPKSEKCKDKPEASSCSKQNTTKTSTAKSGKPAISGYSLKRTEIILLDLISGKEVVLQSETDYESFCPQPLKSENEFYVPQSFSRENLLSHKESSQQNLNNYNSDKEFRTAFVQALRVLYCEEESV